MHLYDGYIFGAGYYLPDSEVQQFIEDTVQLYETHGVGAFDIITPEAPVITDELYPFIINATSWTRLADGVVPARVGQPETILDTSSRSVTDVLDELEVRGSVWVTYTFHNPATDVSQLKRTWLYLYDGLVFGSGYYPHDFRAQSLADSAKILYMARGIAAFDIITPDVPDPLSTQSTFVLNAATLEVEAHGRAPGLVGTISPYLNMADKSLQDIKEELQSHEDGIWVWHMSRNPATQTDQLTHSYIILYDGYIFGASISLPDIRVQSVVDDTIYTYRNNPETGFDVISSGMLNHIDMYPVATNSTHILAHGGVPSLAGSVRPLSTTGNDVMLDQLEEGDSWWTQVAFYDVFTGITQIKRAWYIFHDDYIFLSPYTVADADTQSVTDYARFIYESNRENNAWVDIITPKQPVITDALYPFVINATSWTRLADGVVPARVGQPETILDTSGRSVDDVLAELRENGRIWLTYTFHNPATGVEQLKRTYLQLHDGLVFGSGYYILDSQVQAVTFSSVLQYEDKGKDAAIAAFDATPDEPLATYLFVVDPQTGTTLAQNVNPNLIGQVADWGAITEVLATQDIIDAISRGTGTWVAYNHINPVTSNEETKRTWLVMHDGLIFGSGYYVSDILAPADLPP